MVHRLLNVCGKVHAGLEIVFWSAALMCRTGIIMCKRPCTASLSSSISSLAYKLIDKVELRKLVLTDFKLDEPCVNRRPLSIWGK